MSKHRIPVYRKIIYTLIMWSMLVIVLVGIPAVFSYKTERYRQERQTLEAIAELLDNAVPYERGEGFRGHRFVTDVYLPHFTGDKERTEQLVMLLKRLPKLQIVDIRRIQDQSELVDELRARLPDVSFGTISSAPDDSDDIRVAGLRSN